MADTATPADTVRVNVALSADEHRKLRLIVVETGESNAEIIGRLILANARRRGLT